MQHRFWSLKEIGLWPGKMGGKKLGGGKSGAGVDALGGGRG